MTKADQYIAVLREIQVRLEKGGELFADLGNAAAVLKKRLGFDWVGFYFVNGKTLILGPFQGTPACVFIQVGKGVCGTCAVTRKTIVASDVRQFDGYIACDPESRSEIVVPVFGPEENLQAVLDVDSNQLNAFDETDKQYLEQIAGLLKSCWKG